MMKKLLLLALMLPCILIAFAQELLPLNPEVRHGVLPNGLTYYVLHNEFPKNRANFYIAQRVGSALETPEQYGLAHFLEHMAFNGTKHYPGDSMLRYLESNGIRFGADVNAYTDYEETVYNIDNVPTTNTALMDSVLLCLRDWSCDLLLTDEEIDAERKVIQEEWRMRNDPNHRFRVAMAPVIFSEPQYQLTPIGTMEVVMNFPYKALRDYYHKWYRPDLQGIVVVGDFDAEEMEKKVISFFSDIKMPEGVPIREYVRVSDNEKPLYFAFEDPEMRTGRIDFQVKFDKIPLELQNTDIALTTSMIQDILSVMFNNRLNERTEDADSKFAGAGAYFGDMYPSKTKGIFNIAIIPKGNSLEGMEEALSIVARACKTGFSQSELDRAIEELASRYDKRYNERNNTPTSMLAQELIDAFKDYVPALGIAAEKEFFNNVVNSLPLEVFNKSAEGLITPFNQVLLIQQPQREGMALPDYDTALGVVNDVMDREYEAYVDEVITEPLIDNIPEKGSITKVNAGKFDTMEILLSNGIKVILKPTKFKDDEVLFQAFRDGGLRSYPQSEATNVLMMADAYNFSDMGEFDQKKLSRYLSGKNAHLGYGVGQFTNYFQGRSSVKDLPTLMELIYSSFSNMNPNQEAFDNYLARVRPQLLASENSPEFIFERHKLNAMYGNNPMLQMVTAEMLDSCDYNNAFGLYKESIKNPSDYTFLFTGNVDVDSIKDLLETYIASLPTQESTSREVLNLIDNPKGHVVDNFTLEMSAPADWLFGLYSGDNIEDNIGNHIKVELVGNILGLIYYDILREKEGGVYSPGVGSNFNMTTGKWNLIYFLQTNEEQADRMLQLADELFVNLLKDGATPEQFTRTKNAMLSQYQTSVETNSYWHDYIRLYHLTGNDYISGHQDAIENLSLEDFNSFMKNLLDGKNLIQVNMHGSPIQRAE